MKKAVCFHWDNQRENVYCVKESVKRKIKNRKKEQNETTDWKQNVIL
jgi:hypothetical protein